MKHCKGWGRSLAALTIGVLLLGAIAPFFSSYQALAAGITWHTETVDSSGNVGYYTSLAFDSAGNSAISYFDYAEADLKYAHWNGSSWVVETVDSTGQVGLYTSLAFDAAGYPGISYYDATNYRLKYAHWNGSEWVGMSDTGKPDIVDSNGNVGSYTSLAFDSSRNPSISYYDATNGDLKYAHWNGSQWVKETVDSTGSVGSYTSLAFDSSGNPSISYYDATNTNLKYAHRSGSSWAVETVDSTASQEKDEVGRYTSLAFDAIGYPGISYYDALNKHLKFAHRNGSSWEIEIVDTTSQVGQYTSLAFDPAGYPNISYYDATNHALKYAHQKGSSWVMETVDDASSVGTHTSLAFDNEGNPWISYYDQTNGYLKCATTAPRPTSPPYQPDNISPTDEATDISLTPTLQSSAFSDPDTGDSHYASQWQVTTISGDYTVPAKIYDSEIDTSNLVKLTIPPGTLSIGIKYYWHVRHQDSYANWSAWSEETSFTTALMQPPATPSNISPTDGATDISLTPTLQSSAFSDPDASDSHAASQWQIRTNTGSYNSPLLDSGIDTYNLAVITIPSGILSYGTTYYWRVKHQDSYGNWSAWSEETSFTTVASGAPAQPSNISPADGATDISLTPTLQSSTFSDPDEGDTHAASQWQIRTSTGSYNSPLLDSGIDTSNLTAITLLSGMLSYDTTYYWRVKYQDSYGNWSAWSEETSFTTVASGAPAQPSNISPADEATDIAVTPTLQSSAFSDPDVGDTHAASRWQIRTSTGSYSSPLFDSGIDITNLTQISPPSYLSYNTTYYWRVKYQDSYGNWSDWSEETSFTTVTTSPPNLPINVSPLEEAIEVSLTLTLQSSAFSDPDVVDSQTASQWQVRTSTGSYSSPVFDSETDTTNLTAITLPSDVLIPNTTYYWHIRHQDSYGNWSAYSQETSFATITMPAPEAAFSISAAEVELGQSITLTDLSEGATSWIWDLGDGTTEEWTTLWPHAPETKTRPRDGQFSHTYAATGTYTVSLTVSNPAGSNTQTTDITVYATPQANFSAPAQAEEEQTVTLTDLSTGADSWKWDFGDGTTKRWDTDTRPANGKVTHTYSIAGTYTVSLEISGPRGSNTQTKTITVLAPPAPEGFKFRLWMIGAIVGGILVIAGSGYLVWRWRTGAS
jgi:PKD repeat protein